MHVQGCLILSQVGLLFPVNHAPKIGVPDRLRSGDLLHERQRRKLQAPNTKLQRSPKLQASKPNQQAIVAAAIWSLGLEIALEFEV